MNKHVPVAPSAESTLIPVFTGEIAGQSAQLVDAKLLHQFLEVGRDFSTWIKSRIEEYGFSENIDFLVHQIRGTKNEGRGGNRKAVIDYHLSLDMAKELSMVERNEKGKQARRYFIECERRLLQSHSSLSLDAPDYLKQSRELLSDYADQCIAAVQSTGAKAPNFPVLADGVIDGLIAEKIRHTRLLVSFGADFELQLEQVPRQSCVIDPENLKSVKTVLNEFVPIELMPEILEATSQRITRHFKYLERTTIPARQVSAPIINTSTVPASLTAQFVEDWRNGAIAAPFTPCLGTQALRLFHVWAQNQSITLRLGDNRIMSDLYRHPGLYSKRLRISRAADSNPRTLLMIDSLTPPAGMSVVDWLAEGIAKMEAALNS